jgi:F0F1-type ATP synthase assembly protein I
MLAGMEGPPRPTFDPAGAGALLVSTTGIGIGIGALVGWAAGEVPYGILGGAMLGIPAGIFAVYRRYKDGF